jgi:hypothetical protein
MSVVPRKNVFLWSHAAFDAAILNAWYAKLGISMGYSYKNTLDLRTIRAMFDSEGILANDVPEVLPKHDAVSDCRWQAEWLALCVQDCGAHFMYPEECFEDDDDIEAPQPLKPPRIPSMPPYPELHNKRMDTDPILPIDED